MKKDEVYKNAINEVQPFRFDQTVADAFDDMARRSIPFYDDLQDFIVKMVATYYQPHTRMYDLGCSTGNTVLRLHAKPDQKIRIVAVDKSDDMIAIAKHKCQKIEGVEWQAKGIEDVVYEQASFINISYVLQFIDPGKRKQLLQAMYDGLEKDGVLILSEKVYCDRMTLNDVIVEHYWDFKRSQGYSELEIQQKEDALKSVLVPFTLEQYKLLLTDMGFHHIEVTFKYMNFVSLVAFK